MENLSSNFWLQEFTAAMADELNLPPKDIQFAYHLSTDENWDRMLGDVQQAQVA